MVVLRIYYKTGLGNVLIMASNFIANSRQFNYKLAIDNRTLKRYSNVFDFKKIKNIKIYHWDKDYTNHFVVAILNKIRHILYKMGIYIFYEPSNDGTKHLLNEDKYFLELAQKKTKIIEIENWKFRDFDSLEKYSDFIKSIFTPIGSYKMEIDNFIENIKYDREKKEEYTLIGIHIRRGDYEWCAPNFFYAIDDYIKKMKELASIFKNKNIKFLICSNEILEETLFMKSGLNFVFGLNEQIKDIYSFAKCDYLVGPPSTYTGWASFYGDVPLFYLENIDKPIDLNLFEVKKMYKYYDNM